VNGKRMPRWPLAIIGAPAAVAVWSGWVSLGGLCGFGPVRLLPGIDDHLVINTAVTLPVGIEAYAAYALGCWLTPGTSARARRFARWSALGALALGMLGQVSFHLLNAAHATRAPWPVTMVVACLPVAVMGMGTGLAHLLREPAEVVPEDVTTPARDATAETVAGAVAETVPAPVPEDVPEAVPVTEVHPVPDVEPVAVPVSTVPTAPVSTPQTVAPVRARRRAPVTKGRTPEHVFAVDIAAGELPSLRAIKARLHVGTDRARDILADLQTSMAVQTLTEVMADV
jgi:hypothetical protein